MADYTYYWSNRHAVRLVYTCIQSINRMKPFPWSYLSGYIMYAEGFHVRTFISQEDVKKQEALAALWMRKSSRDRLLKMMSGAVQKQLWMYKKISSTDLSKLSNDQLISLLEKVWKNWGTLINHFFATQAESTDPIVARLQSVTEGNGAVLTIPLEETLFSKEYAVWKKTRKDESEMIRHAAEYPWIAAGCFSKEELLKMLRNRKSDGQEKVDLKSVMKAQKELLAKYPKAGYLADTCQRLIGMRIKQKCAWSGIDFYSMLLLEEIAKRIDEDFDDLQRVYTIPEVARACKGTLLPVEEKAARRDSYCCAFKKGKPLFFVGRESRTFAKRELGDLLHSHTLSIEGQTANKGKTQGKAYILGVNHQHELSEASRAFKKGDILVTEMTQPNMLHLIERAGAIVTNEGGMLSHAAVMAREFNIPCIVGTHFATSSFKTGDRLEVDATKGLVRKIKKQ